ncbi:MAG: Uncharacterized protein G01um101472_31 [Parcubacteria group bacterium Gr01-1014_72]|nr:MAG: Uncharacterized protein G01um101472_31 [Parcubacteria group bacterium Gr01-1014_72]
MKQSRNVGFTLIELMMAIAITALLASIILASLNRGRNQSADAAVQSGFQNLRPQAEAYGAGGGYSGLCTDTRIQEMLRAIKAAAGRPAGEELRCGADANEWVAAELLKSGSTTWWCVDHKGFVGTVANATKNFTVLANLTTDGNIDCD